MKIIIIIIIITIIIFSTVTMINANNRISSSHTDWFDGLYNFRNRLRHQSMDTIKEIKQLKKMIKKIRIIKNWLNESIKINKMNETQLRKLNQNDDNEKISMKNFNVYFKNLFAAMRKGPFKWG